MDFMPSLRNALHSQQVLGTQVPLEPELSTSEASV